MMKQIIEENNLTVMATVARYATAYEAIAKPDWWDKAKRYVSAPLNACLFDVLIICALQCRPHH